MKTKLILATVLFSLMLVGCKYNFQPAADTVPPPTATDLIQPTAQIITESPTLEPVVEEITPTSTDPPIVDTPTPTWEPPASPNCLELSAHEPLEETSYENYPQAILEYLNGGASTEELAAELRSRGIAFDPDPEKFPPVRVYDLTADGVYDVIVSIINPHLPPQGALMVYTCSDAQYSLTHIEVADANFSAPAVVGVQDMNADGQKELITSSESCGAHTCFQDVRIFSWNGAGFDNLLQGSTGDLPEPSFQITDYDRDGVYDFEGVGTTIGSVGAGPQRDQLHVWEYNHQAGYWMVTSVSMGPSNFRIHKVHDADASMRRGEYIIADILYQQVISDDALLDWIDFDRERLNLSAYAYFKRVVAASSLDDLEKAMTLYAEMAAIYSNKVQAAYVEMALAFLESFSTDGQAAGCAAAHAYGAQNPFQILEPLGSEVYGYFNQDYSPEDICP